MSEVLKLYIGAIDPLIRIDDITLHDIMLVLAPEGYDGYRVDVTFSIEGKPKVIYTTTSAFENIERAEKYMNSFLKDTPCE